MSNRHRIAFATVFAVSLVTGIPLIAQAGSDSPANAAGAQATATGLSYTQGEVRKIDLDMGKITLKHGPIENLGMPGMTMIFKVSDPTQLAAFKPGDAVKFKADRVGGALEVTELLAR